MDIFSKELGPSYVPAFAARLLLSMAKGIARASAELKRALMTEEADGVWTLALILVRWYADALPPAEAKLVAVTLADPEMISITASLDTFREPLLPFVKTAHQAQNDTQFAAAGVYFGSAVDQIGLSMLSGAIKSGPVSVLQQKLQARLPLPAEVKADYYRILGVPRKDTEATPTRTSRSDRFDRADFSPRRERRSALPSALAAQARAQTQGPTATPPPTPQLAQADVTRAYLHTLGWEGGDVDRLLAGPNGKPGA